MDLMDKKIDTNMLNEVCAPMFSWHVDSICRNAMLFR
jgi:hypothetical protein